MGQFKATLKRTSIRAVDTSSTDRRTIMRPEFKFVLAAMIISAPTLALAETGGAAAGAAAGGAAGAVVGGPVGAAVGAGVGGAAGDAASGPDQKKMIIEHRGVESTGSVGCSTTTKQKTNELGDTTTKQKTEC
jgi:phage tail tape-measure protein